LKEGMVECAGTEKVRVTSLMTLLLLIGF
jgi:hypothetical protein